MKREMVVISNHWHRPGIKVSILHGADAPAGGIMLETAVDDFLLALADEMRAPVWTKAQLLSQLRSASAVALEKIKTASSQAISSVR